MVSDDIIDFIRQVLQFFGLPPEEIQQVIETIQNVTREELVQFLMELGVPQHVIQYILQLLSYV